MNIYRIIWLTGKVLYELLLGIKDWKSWLLFKQTDRYKLLKNYFKISRRRISERVIFFPLNLYTSEIFLAIWGLFLIGFCVFSVLIFIADFGFSHLGTFRLFYLTEKHVFFGQLLVFLRLPRRRPSVPSQVRGRLLRELGTVEPRLSGLVGTWIKCPDNRKYEY